jgi:hypothetical protein
MSDQALRSKVIRLAHQNPGLRPHLLPLLKGAAMSPPDRKKKVMDIFKRFKSLGDGLVTGGKHKIMLAAEGYETVVLEDAPDEEIDRIHNKYILRVR